MSEPNDESDEIKRASEASRFRREVYSAWRRACGKPVWGDSTVGEDLGVGDGSEDDNTDGDSE